MYSLNNLLNGLEVSSFDASGCFMVPKRKQGFGFRMDLVLHIDDKDVLNYIKHILGIAYVYIKSSSSALFSVISRA